MNLLTQIQTDMKAAMKAREAERLSVLRMIVSAVQYVAIDAKGELSDDQVMQILRTEAKKRVDSRDAYKAAGREDLVEKEQYEIDLIETYLPKLMSETQVREKITGILKEGGFDNFGQAMGAVMGQLKGKADGGMVSKVLKELMS